MAGTAPVEGIFVGGVSAEGGRVVRMWAVKVDNRDM